MNHNGKSYETEYEPEATPQTIDDVYVSRELRHIANSITQINAVLTNSVGDVQTGYTTFANLNTDRTCDADATTVAELADILGTLIEDLKAQGIISS